MRDQNKANQISKFITVVVMVFLIFVLYLLIKNGGLNSIDGVLVSGLVLVLIIVGFLRLSKIKNTQSVHPQNPTSQNVIPSTAPNGTESPSISAETANSVPSAPAPATLTTAPTTPANPIISWVEKFGKLMEKIPKKQQPFLAVGGGIVIVVIVILFINLISGNLFAASPVGTWELEGYEERITYIFFDDGTFVEYDTQDDIANPSYYGHWEQRGKHIDVIEDTCPAMDLYDCHTTYWDIFGNRMTSGQAALNKVVD